MWVILHNNADWDCFKNSDLVGDLEDTKSTSGGTLCIFGYRTCVRISWMCKKQSSVSHSPTGFEIISLDDRLRLDGLLVRALDFCNLIVFCPWKRFRLMKDRGGVVSDKNQRSQGMTNVFISFDCVPSNVQSSRQEALLYVFEDNETVIKMIIKCRSPTTRHVSRTHSVALDWLFDRINLDPKNTIQVRQHQETNSQTFCPREISHVTNGIIFCACSRWAISVLQFALIQWRNNLNKIQEKSESHQNRDLWWILLPGRRRSCRLQLQRAKRRNITEIKINGNQSPEKIDQDDLVRKQIYSNPPLITSMNNSWRASLQQRILKFDYVRAWSSQEWNYDVRSIKTIW